MTLVTVKLQWRHAGDHDAAWQDEGMHCEAEPGVYSSIYKLVGGESFEYRLAAVNAADAEAGSHC